MSTSTYLFPLALCAVLIAGRAEAQDHLEFPGKEGPGKGKKITLIAGDDEYRSEEGLPMLGKILSQRLGFDCTVLFPAGPDGVIKPGDLVDVVLTITHADSKQKNQRQARAVGKAP